MKHLQTYKLFEDASLIQANKTHDRIFGKNDATTQAAINKNIYITVFDYYLLKTEEKCNILIENIRKKYLKFPFITNDMIVIKTEFYGRFPDKNTGKDDDVYEKSLEISIPLDYEFQKYWLDNIGNEEELLNIKNINIDKKIIEEYPDIQVIIDSEELGLL